MKRHGVYAAFVFGIALPAMETVRRGTDFSDIPAYIDDYIAGGLLLFAAWSRLRGKPAGAALLIAAWGIVCGGGYYSFFGQLRHLHDADPSGLPGVVVLAVKGALFAIAIMCLLLSVSAVAERDMVP
ncbi:MAG: hypothetical protein KDA32_00895 [Phycisphaerales bacterium]|nr:hypothetical protein [Phycisphaerales bacterium]